MHVSLEGDTNESPVKVSMLSWPNFDPACIPRHLGGWLLINLEKISKKCVEAGFITEIVIFPQMKTGG